jgi:Flp pilus assembly protein TadD
MTWIGGFLEPNLAPLMQVGLEATLLVRGDLINGIRYAPWQGGLSLSDEAIEHYGRRVLIVGAKGSGKTIALLQVLETHLERALADSHVTLPIALDLSTWEPQRLRNFDDWLYEAVRAQYSLRPSVLRTLLETESVTLYLDDLTNGLNANELDSLLSEMNEWLYSNATEVVVTAQTNPYVESTEYLKLNGAFEIMALDPIDTAHRLRKAGLITIPDHDYFVSSMAGLDFVRTPLSARMAVAISQASYPEAVDWERCSVEDPDYFMRFMRVQIAQKDSPRPTERGKGGDFESSLAWLANSMTRVGARSGFSPRGISTDWLPDTSLRRRLVASRYFVTLILAWYAILSVVRTLAAAAGREFDQVAVATVVLGVVVAALASRIQPRLLRLADASTSRRSAHFRSSLMAFTFSFVSLTATRHIPIGYRLAQLIFCLFAAAIVTELKVASPRRGTVPLPLRASLFGMTTLIGVGSGVIFGVAYAGLTTLFPGRIIGARLLSSALSLGFIGGVLSSYAGHVGRQRISSTNQRMETLLPALALSFSASLANMLFDSSYNVMYFSVYLPIIRSPGKIFSPAIVRAVAGAAQGIAIALTLTVFGLLWMIIRSLSRFAIRRLIRDLGLAPKRFDQFMRDAVSRGLLHQSGSIFRFQHPAFLAHFDHLWSSQNRNTAALPRFSRSWMGVVLLVASMVLIPASILSLAGPAVSRVGANAASTRLIAGADRLMSVGDRSGANDFAVAAIGLRPPSATPYLLAAQLFQELGGDDANAKAIDLVSKKPPSSSVDFTLYCGILGRSGRVVDALVQCRRAVSLSIRSAPAYAVLGYWAYVAKEYVESAHAYASAFDLDNRRTAWIVRACASGVESRDSVVQADVCGRASQVIPDNPDLWADYCDALGRSGQVVEALVQCRRAVSLSMRSAYTYTVLGYWAGVAKEYVEAARAYAAAFELDTSKTDRIAQACRLGRTSGDSSVQAAVCGRASEATPGDADLSADFCDGLAKSGRVGEALVQCRRAVSLSMKSAYAYSMLGYWADIAKEYVEAAHAYAAAFELDTSKTNRITQACQSGIRSGDPILEVDVCRRASEAAPDNPDSGARYCDALGKSGHIGEALIQCRRAVSLLAKSGSAYEMLGYWASFGQEHVESAYAYASAFELDTSKTNRITQACQSGIRSGDPILEVDVCRRASEAAPDNPDSGARYCDALGKSGHIGEALIQCRRAVSLLAKSGSAYEMLGYWAEVAKEYVESASAYASAFALDRSKTERIERACYLANVAGDSDLVAAACKTP